MKTLVEKITDWQMDHPNQPLPQGLAHQAVQKWKSNLRSGHYAQGTEQLVSDEKEYCCLGVLCETIGLPPSVGQAYPGLAVDRLLPFLSHSMPKQHHLEGTRRHLMGHLATLNDQDRNTFGTIARKITKLQEEGLIP